MFLIYFYILYNKSTLFCQGIIAHLHSNDRTVHSGETKEQEENISQPFFKVSLV